MADASSDWAVLVIAAAFLSFIICVRNFFGSQKTLKMFRWRDYKILKQLKK